MGPDSAGFEISHGLDGVLGKGQRSDRIPELERAINKAAGEGTGTSHTGRIGVVGRTNRHR